MLRERETVFHCFMECPRLNSLFYLLECIFVCFGFVFTKDVFILGVKYTQKRKSCCQLLNFVLGKAKMAIWVSRRNVVEDVSDEDSVCVFKRLVKSRILIDFKYYSGVKELDTFESIWCYREVLCSVNSGQLVFGEYIN